MESSSLVSKAKTAFHSAAAKAEKVLTDIKADLKTDHRESEGHSQKNSPKPSELESQSKNSESEHVHESKHSSWKSAHLGIKQDWQDRLKNIRRGKAGAEKEKSIISSSNVSGLDEYLDQMDLGNNSEVKEPERESSAEVEESVSNMANIPPSTSIKQLAIAVESGKKFKSMKDLLASARDSSPVRERGGLSFSAVKSLVLREKEDATSSDFGDDEEVFSLSQSLFDAEGHFPTNKNDTGSAMASLPRDIHGAPSESFVVRLSEIIGNFKTLRQMALLWCKVVAKLRRLWDEGQPVPHVPLDENPDLNSCLLHQQLQLINCCISRKRRRIIASESVDSILREFGANTEELVVSPSLVSSSSVLYARISNGDLVLRLGADHLSKNLIMLETGEPVYCPVTQEGLILTEDLIRETEELVLRTGSLGAGCSQLLSDMQAFKAANPGCILEDFIRWHSPPDWTETDPSNETTDSFEAGDPISKRGQLSGRMKKEGNLWRELWETAKPLPSVKQTPLFDEELAVEGILSFLDDITPFELFQQLFVSLLGSGFVIAEDMLSMNSNLSKLFYECKDYVIATCQGGTWSDNIDDLCQVYETVERILVHPEDCLKIMKQSEETSAIDEPKSRFKKLGLNFSVKDRHFLRKPSPKHQKNQEENLIRQGFPNPFEGKSSLFSKKPPKHSSTAQADAPSPSLEENDWTVV